MIQRLYMVAKVHDTEADETYEKMVPMDTADRAEAIETAKKWLFRHVSMNRDLIIKYAGLYTFSENVTHLHEEGLKERLKELDKQTKEDQIRSLERQLAALRGEGT